MLDRTQLPQIPEVQVDSFREFLANFDVTSAIKPMLVHTLKPIQKHLSKKKLSSIKNSPRAITIPLIVSSDGYVLDGHHRWAAHKVNHTKYAICLVCNTTIDTLIDLGLQFPGAEIKTLHEMYSVKGI